MPPADLKSQAISDRVTIRAMGTLNVVFALALLAAGLCQGLATMAVPFVALAIEREQARDAEAASTRSARAAESRQAVKVADPAGKPEVAREAEADGDKAQVPGEYTAPLKDPRLVGHFLFDMGSGVLLNGLMLASGIGLLYSKSWGRTLALGVAWLKLLRLALLAGSAVFILAPFVQTTLARMEIRAFPDDPKIQVEAPEDGAAVANMARAYGLGLLLLGSIYPAATIRALGRPAIGDALRSRRPLD